MNKYILLVILVFSFWCAKSQLTIRVTSIPASTPADDKIYIAGTMNNWNSGSPSYQLGKNTDGSYVITFTPSLGTVKFKFTRGSWDKVEGNAQGGFLPDRVVAYNGNAKTVDVTITGWEGVSNQVSTASPQVSILSDTFYMPQLNKKRKIWLYLPKDYTTSTKAYPVLYMHDGQNLFDKKTSFSGEWGIDEALDSMFLKEDNGCIVVGIENGGSSRINEFSPWVNPQYGGGEGDKYVDFLVQTLKPYIDQNYRTIPDADHTGVMGSSMGGLISMYAGIKYPTVFSRIGAFSSSFWFSSSSYDYVRNTGADKNHFFYMIAGNQEGNAVADMDKMYSVLLDSKVNINQIFKETHSDGQHSEWYWRREFPKAYKWLFEKKTSGATDTKISDIKIYQKENILSFTSPSLTNDTKVSIYNTMGVAQLVGNISENFDLDISNIIKLPGIYIIQINNESYKMYLR